MWESMYRDALQLAINDAVERAKENPGDGVAQRHYLRGWAEGLAEARRLFDTVQSMAKETGLWGLRDLQENRQDILTWLNGRLVSDLIVRHKGKDYRIWTLKDAQETGLTIEDAVYHFVVQKKIDLKGEVDGTKGAFPPRGAFSPKKAVRDYKP